MLNVDNKNISDYFRLKWLAIITALVIYKFWFVEIIDVIWYCLDSLILILDVMVIPAYSMIKHAFVIHHIQF